MSNTSEPVENKLSSSATKVDDVAIELDSLGVNTVKEVTLRNLEMKSTSTSDRVASAELGGILV